MSDKIYKNDKFLLFWWKQIIVGWIQGENFERNEQGHKQGTLIWRWLHTMHVLSLCYYSLVGVGTFLSLGF